MLGICCYKYIPLEWRAVALADSLLISGGRDPDGVGIGVTDAEFGAEVDICASPDFLGRQSKFDNLIVGEGLAVSEVPFWPPKLHDCVLLP
jgi:hypothetical protein